MPSFEKNWAQRETSSLSDKFRGAVKPQGALKPQIQNAVNKLQIQISKMDAMLAKLQEKDKRLFARIVMAMQQQDGNTSKVLSNELAEVRKVKQRLSHLRISFEQVQLRLATISDLGDAMIEIGPAMNTMAGLKSSLGKFMPEADSEMSQMSSTLNELTTGSLAGGEFSIESDASNEETDKIMQEASIVAGQQIDEKFPSVPNTSGLSSERSTTFE
jgi:division protein CdvB (Snf7/Vps24/ESCRT-III family)